MSINLGMRRCARQAALLGTAVLAAGLLGGCGGSPARGSSSAEANQAVEHALARSSFAGRDSIPMLLPLNPVTVEGDTPPAVAERIEREQRATLDALRMAAHAPATLEAGCRPAPQYGSLGPPAPTIAPRIIGHHVEVVFRFGALPKSAACRPAALGVVVYNGRPASRSFNSGGAVGNYRLVGTRGRFILPLPYGGHPPYHVAVLSVSINGGRGPEVTRALRCPGTRSAVRGCLPGFVPKLHVDSLPTPVLPIRRLTRAQLEGSLRYVLAGQRVAPEVRSAECLALTRCEVTYADPAFPAKPYRVRYRIVGEQVAGCWMAHGEKVIGTLPYQDVGTGPHDIAGCASWISS